MFSLMETDDSLFRVCCSFNTTNSLLIFDLLPFTLWSFGPEISFTIATESEDDVELILEVYRSYPCLHHQSFHQNQIIQNSDL